MLYLLGYYYQLCFTLNDMFSLGSVSSQLCYGASKYMQSSLSQPASCRGGMFFSYILKFSWKNCGRIRIKVLFFPPPFLSFLKYFSFLGFDLEVANGPCRPLKMSPCGLSGWAGMSHTVKCVSPVQPRAWVLCMPCRPIRKQPTWAIQYHCTQ